MNDAIIILDLLSHKNMHLPFNEGYIKSVRRAYPSKRIIFGATQGHIENLALQINDEYRVEFKVIDNFDDLLKGKSYHNPFYSIRASLKCWLAYKRLSKGLNVVNLSILGAHGPLIFTFSKLWSSSPARSLHFIQHNQLSTCMKWRSKNPIIKYFDYLSVLGRGLPNNQKMVMLELGLKEVLAELAPKIKNNIATIEHPVQESEWMDPVIKSDDEPLVIGFVGHCGAGKGFDRFLRLAERFHSEKLEFWAIGKNNIQLENGLTFDGLTVKPCDQHVPREEFVRLLSQVDIICLPLPKQVSYVSSGSIIDAFAACKPLIITNNQSVDAITKKYGEFGVVFDASEDIGNVFESLDFEKIKQQLPIWHHNIMSIRQARSEQGVARQLKGIKNVNQ